MENFVYRRKANLVHLNNVRECDYLFTVFTPTYDRAHTLDRVYNSLLKQSFTDFEWLIVDDGSIDNTEEVIKAWTQSAPFPIRYYYQENGGKHRAFNHGVNEARGNLFLTLDSDDELVPTALETLKDYWDSIPFETKHEYSAVTGLCVNQNGDIVGSRFPTEDWIDSNSIEIRAKYGVTGEKYGFQRTDYLRKYPFPEIEGEKFISESIVWNRMAKWKTRYINKVLRVYYEMQGDSLTVASVRNRCLNPKGARLCYQEYLFHTIPGTVNAYIRNLINYIRFSFHGKISLNNMVRDAPHKWTTMTFIPIGYLFFLLDKRSLNKQ